MCNLHWCYTFCTGVTLFALVLHLNCTALSQSESSNFFMYIISHVIGTRSRECPITGIRFEFFVIGYPRGPRMFLVIFQKRVRVLHRGFKHEKTDEYLKPR